MAYCDNCVDQFHAIEGNYGLNFCSWQCEREFVEKEEQENA